MKIFPAIDIKEGECVRLRQGKFDQKEVFSNKPESIAIKWADCGATMIHVVDLDGALTGFPVNLEVIQRILKTVDVPIQVGGGIRDLETIEKYFSLGVFRVVLGTSAIKNREFLKKAAVSYPGKIAAGIDAKDGKIAIAGWTDVTSESVSDYIKQISDDGIAAVIYTDIEKDGMMQGPNFSRIQEMASSIKVPLVVSGGISTLADIQQLMKIENIEGIIIGKALYLGAISLKEAISLAEGGISPC